MTDPTRPDDAAADEQPTLVTPVEQPTLVTPVDQPTLVTQVEQPTLVATALPVEGASLPPAGGVPAIGVVPPSGPVPVVGTPPRPAGRRGGPWIIVGAVVGGLLLVGGAFAAGFGTGYLVGNHRDADGWGRLDELGSRMDERMDERMGDRLERLDRDRDGGQGLGQGDRDASGDGTLDGTLVTPKG